MVSDPLTARSSLTRRAAIALIPLLVALVVGSSASAAVADPPPPTAAPPAPAAAPAAPLAPAAAPAAAPSPAASTAPPAPAPPSPELLEAERRATALRSAVDALTLQTEQAAEAANRLTEVLAQAAADHAAGVADLRRAQIAAITAAGELDGRVRNIYKQGGTSGLYASMLDGETLHDLLRRVHSIRDVLASDQTASTAAQAAVQRAASAEEHLAGIEALQAKAQADAAAEKNRVTGLLAQQQQLLASTDTAVLAMAEHERAVARQASEQRFAAALVGAGTATSALAADAALASAPGRPGLTPYAIPAVAAALDQIAKPYVWGAAGPDSFDCSGLTSFAFGRAGLRLPRTAAEQWASGPPVALRELSVGDLLFWADNSTSSASIHHVAIYLGSGMMLAAPQTGDVVKIQPVYLDGYFGAVRPGA